MSAQQTKVDYLETSVLLQCLRLQHRPDWREVCQNKGFAVEPAALESVELDVVVEPGLLGGGVDEGVVVGEDGVGESVGKVGVVGPHDDYRVKYLLVFSPNAHL